MPTDKDTERRLIATIKQRLPELEKLLGRASSHWEYEDFVYRFYHHSFKVFEVQRLTTTIVDALHELLPERDMNGDFVEILREGTGRTFTVDMNQRWTAETRPLVEAFLHARFMLEMVVKYGRSLEDAPDALPSGWAAVLYLYGLR